VFPMNSPCLLFSLALLAFSPADRQGQSPFLAIEAADYYWTAHNCCGLAAAYMVCDRLGRPESLDTIARSLKFGPSGTSMRELAQFFTSIGLEAKGVEATTEDLHRTLGANPNLCAVVMVAGNHWITLTVTSRGSVNAFDYPRWHSIALADFEGVYQRQALLVGPSESVERAIHSNQTLGILVASGVFVLVLAAGATFYVHGTPNILLSGGRGQRGQRPVV
jgi:ABC-type bacteriocin/lantibiotic exporter with double-glycine peptidase domain